MTARSSAATGTAFRESPEVPGVVVIDLPLIPDARGWSTTLFDRSRLRDLGLPDRFVPTRWLANHNDRAGSTRGVHAELAHKLVHVSRGRFFAAVVDLRRGPTFGNVAQVDLDPSRALFIPIGCGNSYQTQTDDAQYSYVADDALEGHPLTAVDLGDPDLAIPWPIPLDRAVRLDEDLRRPRLVDVDGIDVDQLFPTHDRDTHDREETR